jgi:hypothetical protein
MLEQLETCDDGVVQYNWARCIRLEFNSTSSSQLEAILAAIRSNECLASEFGDLFSSMDLGSERALQAQSFYRQCQESEDQRNPVDAGPTRHDRIEAKLLAIESGDLDGWCHLNLNMMGSPRGAQAVHFLETDHMSFPSWLESDEAVRGRIVEAAKRYLAHLREVDYTWILSDRISHPGMSGYRAFQLLRIRQYDFLDSLSQLVWKRWAPVILGCPTNGTAKDVERQRLVEYAYSRAPDEIIEMLTRLIDKENANNLWLSTLRKLDLAWDDRIASCLIAKVQDERLTPSSIRSLLGSLLDHNVADAKTFAIALLAGSSPVDDHARTKSLAAAVSLLGYCRENIWFAIWPAIQENVGFGQTLFLEPVMHS